MECTAALVSELYERVDVFRFVRGKPHVLRPRIPKLGVNSYALDDGVGLLEKQLFEFPVGLREISAQYSGNLLIYTSLAEQPCE